MASCKRARLRVSRIGLIAFVLSALGGVASQSLALGLGEIEVDSALNERLRAAIPLVDAAGLQPDEVRVSLASAEDFQRVGVERFFFLSDLRFQVEVGPNGAGYIRVSSEGAITEPYLNFLVQLQWPQGRLLKEYTVLLDPPTFSQAAAPAISGAVQAAPGTAGSSSGTIQRQSVQESAPPRPAVASRAPAGGQARAAEGQVGGEHRVGDGGGTLWSIAGSARPSQAVSIQQTMLAIQRLNPDAFLDGNINRLKAGVTLQLPSEQDALEIGAAEALEQVAMQDRSWRGALTDAGAGVAAATERAATERAPTERAAIDATPGAVTAAPATDTEGRLKIVAGTGDSVTGTPEPEAAPANGAALASALEERDRLNLEVADLTSQIDREKELAANQLAVRERQIEVKDQQIAEMQAELAKLREAGGVAGDEERKQDQSVSASAGAWWQAPGILGAGAGVVVLLLAGGLVAARRRRIAAADAAGLTVYGRPAAVPHASREAGAREPVINRESAPADQVAKAAALRSEPALVTPVVAAADRAVVGANDAAALGPVAAEVGGELVDVIGEADIYIAYGRYGQATDVLQGALREGPDRHDVRLKQLEIFAETGDQAGFDREFAELAARCNDPGILRAAEALSATGAPAVLATDLAAGAFAGAAVVAAVAGGSVAGGNEAAPYAAALPDDLSLDSASDTAADAAPGSLEIELEALAGADQDVVEALVAESEAALAADAALEIPELELGLPVESAAVDMPVFDEPIADLPELELDLDLDLEMAQLPPSIDPELEFERPIAASESDLLGGDRGIDFRLEEDDLDGLDEAELALEMDGLPVSAPAEDEFDFADEGDSASTKLDLARAYSEMGDPDGAREILLEVLREGTEPQQQAARELLDKL